MKLEEYNTIIHFIEQHTSSCPRTVLSAVNMEFGNNYQYHTVMSIFLTYLQGKVKSTYHSKTKETNSKYYYRVYKESMNKAYNVHESKHSEQTKTFPDNNTNMSNDNDACAILPTEQVNCRPVLINMANEFELPPCLLARLIIEQYVIQEKTLQDKENRAVSISEQCPTAFNIERCMKHISLMAVSSFEENAPLSHEIRNSEVQKSFSTAKTPSRCQSSENKYADNQVSTSNHRQQNSVGQNLHTDCQLSKKTTSDEHCQQLNGKSDSAANRSAVPNSASMASIKNKVSSWMKDPLLIPNEALREQVLQCISYDVCYGPINDAIRHSVGLEFEEILIQNVKKHNLPFLDENDLRKRGYDKTPDVKLEVPISVNGFPVCWIESKASFGDLQTHSEYLRDQYYSYWNRFGPGIVIYWFGFIDNISDDMKKLGILVLDDFPSIDQITFMDP